MNLQPVPASRKDFEDFSTEMTAKARNWQLHLFGGVGHTFTDPVIDALNLPSLSLRRSRGPYVLGDDASSFGAQLQRSLNAVSPERRNSSVQPDIAG